jgi:uncharacterized protein
VFLSSRLAILIAVFFFTSVLSVITGSTSLVTVPVMIQFGIEPHVAIATNMLALIFMSAGGSLVFACKDVLIVRRLPASILLTIAGSMLGALLLFKTSDRTLDIVIAVAMMVVGACSLVQKDFGARKIDATVSSSRQLSGYAAIFLLAAYGGFFSGGYVTALTYVFVTLFGMTLLQSVAATKFVNMFSSTAATLVFLHRGIVDYKLGIVLGIAMFAGAMIGGRVALKLNTSWIRHVFIATVFCLAARNGVERFSCMKTTLKDETRGRREV